MRVALAQLNPTVGDVTGNTRLVLDAMETARRDGAGVLVCPEMAVLGYPPRDLLLQAGVVARCEEAVRRIAAATDEVAVVVGHPRAVGGGLRGVRNAASVCHRGAVAAVYDKRLLPGYDIFDEDRYFDRGDRAVTVEVAGGRAGLLICEDLWRAGDVIADPRYDVRPLAELTEAGCDLVLCLNASPFMLGKFPRHVELVRSAARAGGVPIVTVNQVGANDDLVFDGRSLVVDREGRIQTTLRGWTEEVVTVDLDEAGRAREPAEPEAPEDLFHALVLGVRDYCRKSGFARVLVGVSGGIDSAVTATIAAAALGPANVTAVIMPSRYSSSASRTDALALAASLGLGRCEEVGLERVHEAMRTTLAGAWPQAPSGITDENLQARLRGVILMAYANPEGALVLATGNKSELAVGYSTLYGDMCGSISVLGDVVKTRVYALAGWINAHHAACGSREAPIPSPSITKPPSAELRPDQTDQDALPPYDVLDAIIERYVEQELPPAVITEATGFDPGLVGEVTAMIDRAEYKRHQAAVILKVTQRAFGRGRPMPIVARGSAGATGRPTDEGKTGSPVTLHHAR